MRATAQTSWRCRNWSVFQVLGRRQLAVFHMLHLFYFNPSTHTVKPGLNPCLSLWHPQTTRPSCPSQRELLLFCSNLGLTMGVALATGTPPTQPSGGLLSACALGLDVSCYCGPLRCPHESLDQPPGGGETTRREAQTNRLPTASHGNVASLDLGLWASCQGPQSPAGSS